MIYRNKIILLIIFGVAMGYFEAALVIYLRELYYPDGFSFPLIIIPERIILVELIREISTIVMLIAVAAVSGRKFWERFGYFIIIFGIWDIFYYVWLKVILDWPSSLFDYDILFLIPLPWIGPVIAPVLISILMISFGIIITKIYDRGHVFRPSVSSWILAIPATLVILYSFMRDTQAGLYQTSPQPYAYWLLGIGIILYTVSFIIAWRRSDKSR
jgi:hypothetical protein